MKIAISILILLVIFFLSLYVIDKLSPEYSSTIKAECNAP